MEKKIILNVWLFTLSINTLHKEQLDFAGEEDVQWSVFSIFQVTVSVTCNQADVIVSNLHLNEPRSSINTSNTSSSCFRSLYR